MTSDAVIVTAFHKLAAEHRERSLVGKTIGTIAINRQLGYGNFAVVYSGLCSVSRSRVAVKVLTRPEGARRFQAEYRSLRQVRSPHVVRVHSYGTEPVPHYVMDHIHGTTLHEYIAAKGKLDIAEAIDICRQICSGLHDLHRVGVVHRDINPRNLIRSADGRITIIDLGIARRLPKFYDLLGSMTDPELRVVTTSVLHSPGYGAPEVIAGQPATEAADIYALGAVMHKLLTGRLYDPGHGPARSLDRQIRNFLVHATNSLLSHRYRSAAVAAQELDDLARCFGVEPSDSYELATDTPWLTRVREDWLLAYQTRLRPWIRQVPARLPRWGLKSRWLIFLASALIPLLVVLTASLLDSGSSAPAATVAPPTTLVPQQSGSAATVAETEPRVPETTTQVLAEQLADTPMIEPSFSVTSSQPSSSSTHNLAEQLADPPDNQPSPSVTNQPDSSSPRNLAKPTDTPTSRPSPSVTSTPAKPKPREPSGRNLAKQRFRQALAAALPSCQVPPQKLSYRVRGGEVRIAGPALASMPKRCLLLMLPTSGNFRGNFNYKGESQ